MERKEEEILKKLVKAFVNLEIETVEELTLEAIETGIPAKLIIQEGFSKGLEIVGKRYERREYFLTELIAAGLVAEQGLKILEPYWDSNATANTGTVVIGTVKGDLHDIGKNIFANMLKAEGFKVYDLGTDVPAEKFVKAVKEHSPHIVALSALLTDTLHEMQEIIHLLKAEGLREKVKIMVGGRPVTQKFAEKIGADYYSKNVMESVKMAKKAIKR